jgi:hypothetical protein
MMSRLRALALVLVLAVSLLGLYAGTSRGQVTIPTRTTFNSFAIKFMCGQVPIPTTPEEPPVKPGNYATAINLHNPNINQTVDFLKKPVLLFNGAQVPPPPPEQEVAPGPIVQASLHPDFGMEIDCNDIRNVLLGAAAPPAPTFIKGWVVILQPVARKAVPLDVTAVYTGNAFQSNSGAPSSPEGFSLEVVTYQPKLVSS